MRLLKVTPSPSGPGTLELVERFGHNIPRYAILSHTWGDDEVFLSDIQNGTAAQRSAHGKVVSAIKQSRKDGYAYLWVDTCCIDKSSSAELSEAINSMYAWYQKAEKCYAFLADVSYGDPKIVDEQVRRSRWFTRGWTLQELLAPRDLEFFSLEWSPIGDRWRLQRVLSMATRIDGDYLTGFRSVDEASVAARMSWAASRQTTREEDTAYCLVGLFSVNMPLLYGEGNRAFLRLQEEIMRHSDDHSLFAWSDPRCLAFGAVQADLAASGKLERRHGLLADSPTAFTTSGSIKPWDVVLEQTPYIMTNRGLSIDLHLARLDDGLYAASLDCHFESRHDSTIALHLRKLDTGPDQYARVDFHVLGSSSLQERGSLERIFVRQNIPKEPVRQLQHFIQLRTLTGEGYTLQEVRVTAHAKALEPTCNALGLPQARVWMPGQYPTVFRIPRWSNQFITALRFSHTEKKETLWVLLGATDRVKVGLVAVEDKESALTWGVSNLAAHYGMVVQLSADASEFCWVKNGVHKVRMDTEIRSQPRRTMYVVDVHLALRPTPSEVET